MKRNHKKPCFLAGTLVHTEKGLVPIELIDDRTQVLCYDEVHKKITQQRVTKTYTNFTEKYAYIITESGSEFNVTGQHLFYQKNSETWIKAYQLKVGMHLYNPITNKNDKIISKEVITSKQTTYNIEVPIHHNYIVGENGILAHNANKRPSYKDPTIRGYSFYELATRNGPTLYIGKTTREDIDIRASEHKYEGKSNKAKNIKDYTWWKFEINPSIYNINNRIPEKRYVYMIEFESAIWERYFMEVEKAKGTKLKNRQYPLGKKINSKTFAKYKKYWAEKNPNFNPCQYF